MVRRSHDPRGAHQELCSPDWTRTNNPAINSPPAGGPEAFVLVRNRSSVRVSRQRRTVLNGRGRYRLAHNVAHISRRPPAPSIARYPRAWVRRAVLQVAPMVGAD